MGDPQPGTERPAAVLRERREEIVEAWEAAVRASPAGPRLDGPSLRDHLPDILDCVASSLAPRAAPDCDPRVHGRTRASQGVSVVSVLAELGILRRIVLDFWAEEGPVALEALRALDRVLDASAIEAARRIMDTHDAFFRGVDAISRASLEARHTDELLRRLLEEIVRTSGAVDTAVILLRQGDRLTVRAAVGGAGAVELDREGTLRVGEGFAGRVAAEARPILVEDASKDPLVAKDALPRRDVRVLYGVPLLHGGDVIGVAHMGSVRAASLEPEDRRLFESMASRAALAVARQLALDEERRRREELALLSRLSHQLVERMELEERLRRAAEALVPELADACAIVLVEDGRPRRVAMHASDRATADSARPIVDLAVDPGAASGLGRVLREGAPELVQDVEAQRAAAPWREEVRALFGPFPLRSYVAVPMSLPSGIIGALVLGTGPSGRRFDDASRDLALEIGGRIAVAVDNARLFAKARREALLREQILAIVSHDLRNPLSAVVMGAGRIEAKEADREEILRVTGAIRRAARRMERLISDLVDVASIQSGRLSVSPQPRPPGDLVREAVDAMKPLAQQRGLSLGGNATDLPDVLADHDRILQVFGNLLSNALDVTPQGGRVEVRAVLRGPAVRFSVSDTGPGLAPGEAEHVFEPYRRGSAAGYKGTGLGLAIASGIVAAHGGEIGVDSEPGRGATFWFTLPAAAGSTAR